MHPKLLDGFNYESKCEDNGRKKNRAHSLAYNTSRVEMRVGVPGSKLGRLKSNSITHMELHKLNIKLVNA